MLQINPMVPKHIVRRILTGYKAEIQQTMSLCGTFTIDFNQHEQLNERAYIRETIDRQYAIIESESTVGFTVVVLH